MTHSEITELWHYARTNTYLPHGDIENVDCVIGFSFGCLNEDGRILPGKSNEQLARYIDRNFPNTPLILQVEIADALPSRTPALTIREARITGHYLSSKELAEQAALFMKKHGWRTAAIVTHPAMEARNDAICRKLGINTVLPPNLEHIQYEPASAQPWTKDKESWWEREEQIIVSYAEKGWI